MKAGLQRDLAIRLFLEMMTAPRWTLFRRM